MAKFSQSIKAKGLLCATMIAAFASIAIPSTAQSKPRAEETADDIVDQYRACTENSRPWALWAAERCKTILPNGSFVEIYNEEPLDPFIPSAIIKSPVGPAHILPSPAAAKACANEFARRYRNLPRTSRAIPSECSTYAQSPRVPMELAPVDLISLDWK